MSLLDKLKAVLVGGSNRESGSSNATSSAAGATTTANTSSESAVKEPVDPTPSTSDPSIDDDVEAADETPDTTDAITEAESEDEESVAEGGESVADAQGTTSGAAVSEISGIGPAYSDRLESIGIETVDQLAEAEPDDIASQTDISIGRVSNWIERARNF
jgi:predicted flap endonuclease-1-like 5' DNA nuclease